MIATPENDSFRAIAPRCLKHVVTSDDVSLQDRFPRSFTGVAAQVHDGICPFADRKDVSQLYNIRLHKCLAR